MTRTYLCKQVIIACGNHVVTGYAEDSFVTIEPISDGIMSKTGCDGEVERAVDPSKQRKVKLTTLQTSPSNAFFQQQYDYDQETGQGTFPVLIKNLSGQEIFSAETGWVVNSATVTYGKDTNAREWEIDTADGSNA